MLLGTPPLSSAGCGSVRHPTPLRVVRFQAIEKRLLLSVMGTKLPSRPILGLANETGRQLTERLAVVGRSVWVGECPETDV
jgi:hypothetical protein